MKTILVTGGAGFIGVNFIYHELAARPDARIVCLDKLTYAGNLASLSGATDSGRFFFARADIADETAVDAVFDRFRPDTVVNFAAESHVDRSIADPGIFITTNVSGVRVLMDACLKYGVGRFHQVSTDEVYGDLPLDRPELRFSESCPLRASSPYSASKAGADLLVGAYIRTFGLPATISRCSNNYGPFQFPEKLIPLMITRALAGEPMPVYGEGLNVRDWLYTADHCAAIDLILDRGVPGETYNLGGDCELRNIDVARRICAELGRDESLITHVADRKGHDLRYAIDHSFATRALGWRPATSFDDGIRLTVQWYLEHPGWLADIASGEYRRAAEKCV